MKHERKQKGLRRETRQYIFFLCLLALPLLQFAIFYIGVNINSLLLTFRNFDYDTGYRWVGFENLSRVFRNLTQSVSMHYAVRNSLLAYAVTLLIGTPLALLFSYFIYKKMPLGGLFKVTLFMPSILSSIVMVLLFKYFCEDAVPELYKLITGKEITGLLSSSKTSLGTLLFYQVWVGFGPQILMYTGAMNNIPESVVEAAELDGITPIKEFWYITLPMIWPTFVTFIVIGIAGIFTGQLNLFSFYGGGADIKDYTLGYYLYRAAKLGDLPEYPDLAALGIILTLIALPLTLLVKFLMERFGPKTDY